MSHQLPNNQPSQVSPPGSGPSALTPPGLNILLLGEIGSGKSHSLRTLVDAGIVPFVLMTEPSHMTFGDIKCPQLHYAYVPPATVSFQDMIDMANKINTLSLEGLTKLADPHRSKHIQWTSLLRTLTNFVCDRCGQAFGPVDEWSTGQALCLDSMSGVNPMAMGLVAGDKPIKSQADWQMAQGIILQLVQRLCTNTRAWFVMTGHLERETNEVTGGVHLTIATLGKKLAPQIPKFFDEVIHCTRDGDKFLWSTTTYNTSLKTRVLQFSDKLVPTFPQLVQAWIKRGGVIEPVTFGPRP